MAMKLDIRIHGRNETHDHQVELLSPEVLRAGGGKTSFRVDRETGETDWAEIAPGVYSILLGGRSYEAHLTRRPGEPEGRTDSYLVTVGTRQYLVDVRDPRLRRHAGSAAAAEGPQEILAPMPGKIVRILVSENQEIVQGDGLLVIEAMKMQNELRAPRHGRVEKIYVREGAGVESGFKLLRLI